MMQQEVPKINLQGSKLIDAVGRVSAANLSTLKALIRGPHGIFSVFRFGL
jgi:hypothetical protein